MGFFGDLLLAGAAAAADALLNDSSEKQQPKTDTFDEVDVTDTTGTDDETNLLDTRITIIDGKKKDFFKLLKKWDDIFQREGLIVDPKRNIGELWCKREAPYRNPYQFFFPGDEEVSATDYMRCFVKLQDNSYSKTSYCNYRQSKFDSSGAWLGLIRWEDSKAMIDVWEGLHFLGDNDAFRECFLRYYPNKKDTETYLIFSFHRGVIYGVSGVHSNAECGFLHLEFNSKDKNLLAEVVIHNQNSHDVWGEGDGEGIVAVKGLQYIGLDVLLANLKSVEEESAEEDGNNDEEEMSDVYAHLLRFIQQPYSLSEAEIARRKAEEEKQRQKEEMEKRKEEERLAEIERQKQIEEEKKKMEREETASLLDSL